MIQSLQIEKSIPPDEKSTGGAVLIGEILALVIQRIAAGLPTSGTAVPEGGPR